MQVNDALLCEQELWIQEFGVLSGYCNIISMYLQIQALIFSVDT